MKPIYDSSVVVITGVTGGVGCATAHAFAREGRSLILCGRKAGPLEDLKIKLGSEKYRVDTVCCDISDVTFPQQIFTVLAGRKIDVLAHAAGISPTMGSGKQIWDVNFTSTKRLVEMLMPYMVTGSVTILVSSMAGEFGSKFIGTDRILKRSLKTGQLRTGRLLLHSSNAEYVLSKRAVQLYAKAMAPVFGKTGSRIVSLSPGIIDTNMARKEKEDGADTWAGKKFAKINGMVSHVP